MSTLSAEPQRYPFLEIIAASVIEFLVPGGIYSFGVFAQNVDRCDDAIWYLFAVFAFCSISDVLYYRSLRKYLVKRERCAITLLTLVLTITKLVAVYCGNGAINYAAQGCVEGICTGILLALIGSNRNEYFSANQKRSLMVVLLPRAFALLMLPLYYQIVDYYYTAVSAQIIYAGLILHVIPAGLLIFLRHDEEERVKEMIEMRNVIYRDYYSDDYNDDFWEHGPQTPQTVTVEESDESEQSEVLEPRTPLLNDQGVEIMPIIDEERESISTIMHSQLQSQLGLGLSNNSNNLKKSRTFNDLHDENDNDWKLKLLLTVFNLDTAQLSVLVFTKLSMQFAFLVYLMVIPRISMGEAVIPLLGSMWVLFLLLFSYLVNSQFKRLLVFVIGLSIMAFSTYVAASWKSVDAVTSSSLMFGFGCGAVSYVETSVFEDYIKPEIIPRANFTAAILLLVTYALIYLSDMLGGLFYGITWVISINVFIWSCIPVIKSVWNLKKRHAYEVDNICVANYS